MDKHFKEAEPRKVLSQRIAKFTKDTLFEDINETISQIALLENESERDFYIKKLHDKTGLSLRAINKDVQGNRSQNMTCFSCI